MSTNIVPHFLAAVAVAVVSCGVVAYNNVNSTETIVGEKYAYTYSYCEHWTFGPKGVSQCAKRRPAVEYRVNTVVKGPLFEYESYKVVAE